MIYIAIDFNKLNGMHAVYYMYMYICMSTIFV